MTFNQYLFDLQRSNDTNLMTVGCFGWLGPNWKASKDSKVWKRISFRLMDFRVKVYSKIQRPWRKKTPWIPTKLGLKQKEKKMTSSWHHHFFPTQTRKESAPPMFWMLVCYHFFLLKQNASFFRRSCADDLEYQSHVTGRSWAVISSPLDGLLCIFGRCSSKVLLRMSFERVWCFFVKLIF